MTVAGWLAGWCAGGVVCSDDDLRAIVHEHRVRWSPLSSQSTSVTGGGRHAASQQRSASLDTSSGYCSHHGVFTSSVESLTGRSPSPSPVFPAAAATQQQQQPSPSDPVALPQPPSAAQRSKANVQPPRTVR